MCKSVLCVCMQRCGINTWAAKLSLSSLICFSCSHSKSVLFATLCISQVAKCAVTKTPSISFASPVHTRTHPPDSSQARGSRPDPPIPSRERGKELNAKSTRRTRSAYANGSIYASALPPCWLAAGYQPLCSASYA